MIYQSKINHTIELRDMVVPTITKVVVLRPGIPHDA
jgi:hypothetical protein